MLKSKLKYILPLLLVAYMAIPLCTHAAFAGLVPCGNQDQAPCTVQDFLIGTARITNFLISLAGLYAIAHIIFAGFWLVVSNGDRETIEKNQAAITNAVVGMVMVLLAFLLVATLTNTILAQGDACKKIDLTNPISYIQDTSKNNPSCK